MAGFAIGAFACGGKIAPGTRIANVDACALPSVCTLISSAQISEATGTTFSPGATQTVDNSEGQACSFFDASGNSTNTTITVIFDCPQQSPDVYRAEFAQQAQLGDVSVSGVGDEALWVPDANELAVLAGQNAFAVAIEFSNERTDELQSQATAIAQDVIANL